MQSTKFLVIAALMAVVVTSADAVQTSLTVYDGFKAGSSSWYNTTAEDQEVEPNNVASQAWDLEGFLLDETTRLLSMVGGYDFKNGKDGFTTGDLFFSTAGNVVYGADAQGLGNAANGNQLVDNQYGYEVGVRLNFANNTYAAYTLQQDSTLVLSDVWYAQNSGSDPWRMADTWLSSQVAFATGSFSYESNASQYAIENGGLFLGGANSHRAVNLDLSGIVAEDGEFTVHYTMGCGNDNLIGHFAGGSSDQVPQVPDAGSASILLGLGLMGIGAFVRRLK